MPEDNDAPTSCWIYKSTRKEDMYLYLAQEDGFDDLPAPLRQGFGAPQLVMQLELHPQRRLARAETGEVIASLRTQGFYLQMPPELKPELFRGD